MMNKSIILTALASAAMLMSCTGQAPVEQGPAKKELKPTVVAVAPMDPGQKSFGSGGQRPANIDTTGMAARRKAMMEERNRIRTIHFNDLAMSD